MQIGRVSRVCINSLPLSNVGRVVSVVDRPVILGLVSSWVNTSGFRIGHVNSWGILVYIRMYRAYVHTLLE